MKIGLTGVFVFLFHCIVVAQSDIQKCGDKKNEEFQKLLKSAANKDSVEVWRRRFIQMDKDWEECLVGKSIADLTFLSLSGQKFDAKNLEGKVVVINFWFIACTPCMTELPALNRLVAEYKDSSVVFLGLTYDGRMKLDPFLAKVKFDFSIIPDSKDINDLFGINEYPTTLIIDKNKIIRKIWIGAGTIENAKTEAYLKAKPIIDELLKAE